MGELMRIAGGMRRVLAIDPGTPDIGAALFDDGRLVRAAWVKLKRPVAGTCPACRFKKACRHGVDPRLLTGLCDAIERELGLYGRAAGDPALPESVVLELPYYQARFRGGTVIGKLVSVVAAMADRAAAWGAAAYWYQPSEWKGTAPKEAHQAVGLCGLTDAERAILPRIGRGATWHFASDPLDAALLGDWWLKRGGGRRVPQANHRFEELRQRVQKQPEPRR